MSIRVRIEHGQGAGTTWRLTQPGVYLMGRAKSCSIQVLDLKVSKEHCEIHLADDGETAVLHDIGSAHGYTLNGQPKKGDNAIRAGDELRLGLSILRILSDGAADHELTPITGRSAKESSQTGAAPVTKNALPADALVGKELSGYRIQRKIGAGGMGGVYLAEQISLKRQVALKVLNERFGSDSAFVDQFVNEARAAGALNHPNVVQVYDVGSAEGHYFFSMEVMPGGSIEDRVKEDGAIPWKEALNWFLDAANALIFAHKKEILHRDVKPDNLMVAEDGSAKLCDLGLAKKSENSDLMDQGIIGTPHFISPEAIRRKPDIDHRTDLYSLGCSFYRVLTGGNPYPGKTVKEILLGHLNKPAPRVSAKQSDIPRDLDDVVQNLMEKDPDNRIQTPEELLDALDKVRLRHGLEEHGIRPHSRKPMLIAASVALLAIAGGIWFATRPKETVVQKRTVAEVEAAKQAAIGTITNEVDGVVKTDVPATFLSWERTLLERDLKSSERDEWKDPFWVEYLQEHRDTATEWNELAETWRGRGGKQEFDDARNALTEGAAFLDDQAKVAVGLAEKHAKYIEGRRKNESAIRTARADARQAFDQAVADHKKKIDDAFSDGRYLEMAVLLRRKQIEDFVKPLRTREKLEVRLLDGKMVDETVKKTFGDVGKDGPFKDWYGIKRLKEARAQMQQTYKDAIKAADLKPASTIADIEAAMTSVQSFVDRLPATQTPDAGSLNALLVKQAKDAKAALTRLAIRRYKDIRASYAEDKIAAQAFIEKVFAPRSAGGSANLRRLGILDAVIEANALAKSARMPEYKVFANHWKRAAEGVKAAVSKLVSTFPKNWSSTKYRYTDSRGREKSKAFKDVSDSGFSLGRDAETFSDRTPKWIVENIFYDGDQRRFALEGVELLGLATLAELGARFDLAKTAYEAYATSAGDDAKAGVAMRLASLDAEKEAADVWMRATKVLEEIEAFNRDLDPRTMNEEEFEKRSEEVFNGAQELAPKIAEAQALRTRLLTDAKLASTIWGAAVRDGTAHTEATFAGETPPARPKGMRADAPKKDAPKTEDGDKKGEIKSDGEKKKDEGGSSDPEK